MNLKALGILDKAKIGEKISVLLERIEDKNGEVSSICIKSSKNKRVE